MLMLLQVDARNVTSAAKFVLTAKLVLLAMLPILSMLPLLNANVQAYRCFYSPETATRVPIRAQLNP